MDNVEWKCPAGAGGIAVSLPVSGVPPGPIAGEFNFSLGNLTVQTSNGRLSATFDLGGGVTITGSRLEGTPEGGLELVLEDPKLRYEPASPEPSTLSGGSPRVTRIGASFVADLKSFPEGIAMESRFSRDIRALADNLDTRLDQAAQSVGGAVGNLDQDVAFALQLNPVGITGDDIGLNQVTLEVNKEWYADRIAESF